ncbi:MAG: hypothetical protein ACOZJX_05775 [Pseudomonadota bacterium]
MTSLLAANPGLMVVLALLAGGTLVFSLLAFIMHRSGASLRPIAFVAGFFAIVLLPQVAGHLALAVRPGEAAAAAGAPAVPARAALPEGARAEDWRAVYGPRMPGLQDAPARVWASGQSLAALRFASAAQAGDGLMAYLAMHSVAPTLDRGGNEVRGSRGLGGGFVHLRRDGATLHIAAALDEPALDALLPASATQATTAPTPLAEPQPLVPALQPATRWMREHVAAQVGAVLLLLAVAVGWFFRVGSWAAAKAPVATTAPLTAEALRARLLALAAGDNGALPPARTDGRIAIGFTLTDARWLSAAGLNRARRVHRLLLRLDPGTHTVWVTEQWSRFDAQAGAAGGQLRWSTAMGISFFERSRSVEAGIVLGKDGRPAGALLHHERIDLQALKAPCIAAVTGAGWRWRPVMLDWAALFGRGGD